MAAEHISHDLWKTLTFGKLLSLNLNVQLIGLDMNGLHGTRKGRELRSLRGLTNIFRCPAGAMRATAHEVPSSWMIIPNLFFFHTLNIICCWKPYFAVHHSLVVTCLSNSTICFAAFVFRTLVVDQLKLEHKTFFLIFSFEIGFQLIVFLSKFNDVPEVWTKIFVKNSLNNFNAQSFVCIAGVGHTLSARQDTTSSNPSGNFVQRQESVRRNADAGWHLGKWTLQEGEDLDNESLSIFS